MNKDLLECKSKAKQQNESVNPPRNANGRKKGYMKIMKELWDELGYANMYLTSQNLRDQAARLEKRSGNVMETIVESAGLHRDREPGRETTESTERINIEEQPTSVPNTESSDLHNTPSMEAPLRPSRMIKTETQSILKIAYPIFTSEVQIPGDFKNRSVDTRTKKRPSEADIGNINEAIGAPNEEQHNRSGKKSI